MKTKAVRLYGKQDLRLDDVILPEISDDEVLVEVISDSLCMSTYKASIEGSDHKRVPEDISVVGYDGISMANYSVPRLTTIRQDTQRMAEEGVQILLKNIQRKHRPVHEIIPFQLIPGESAGKREG